MIAIDTSVVVAAFASWHEGHASAASTLARKPRVPAHVLVETNSVLTRLPAPHRAPAPLVAEFLSRRFTEPPLLLPARAHLRLLEEVAALGLAGGSAYDALIGATVRHTGARLVTRDRRAATTYERLRVEYELLD